MKKEIKEILDELYNLDSSLKEKESDLIEIISRMIDYKPDVKIDKQFKKELKEKVLLELEKKDNSFFIKNISKFLWVFFSGAVALMLVINIFPNIFYTLDSWNKWLELSFDTKIEKLNNTDAFGALTFNNESASAWIWWAWIASEKMATESRLMVNPDYRPKVYVYNLKQWEVLPEIPESMYVYKKQNNNLQINNLNLKQTFKTDVIDLSNFKNLSVSNINLYENAKSWYQLNMSLKDWILNIYRNYDSWSQQDYTNRKRLTIDDIPNDDKLIKLVNSFASNYSINISKYLNPSVENSWKTYYNNSEDKDNYYIPEILSVVYQLELDWKWVYETIWVPYWLNSTVNIIDMKVNSFGPIQKLNLEWSNYKLITDEEKILEEAKKWNYYVNPISRSDNEDFEKINIDIWEAKLVYLRKNSYDSKTNNSEEYFVPWLLFKVLTPNDNEKNIYPWEFVSVPLVWGFLNEDAHIFAEPLIKIE